MMELKHTTFRKEDLQNLDTAYRRNFINSLSGYKSINLIGTIDTEGNPNLAIYNTIIHVSSNPPMLAMLVRTPVKPRHTLTNIRETGVYTLNHIKQEFFNKAHQTAARYHGKKSEFEIVGLKQWYSEHFKAPFVHESPVKIGFELREEYTLKSNGAILIIGEIVEATVQQNAILSDGLVDLGVTGTITASGLDTYYTTRKIARLSFAKPDEDLDVIG